MPIYQALFHGEDTVARTGAPTSNAPCNLLTSIAEIKQNLRNSARSRPSLPKEFSPEKYPLVI